MTKNQLIAHIHLAQQEQWQELNLAQLALIQLPPDIGQLDSLRTLYLYLNQLRYLPPEIGQLTALEELVIGSNQLRWLPAEIAQIKQLRRLYAPNNQLSRFPPDITRLSALYALGLSNNPLTCLPPDIVQLSRLRELYLDNTQLHALPPDIGQLNLAVLDVSHNHLSVVAPELALFPDCRVLDLRHNPCSLPNHIGELKKQGAGVYIPENCYLPDEMLNESSGMIDRYLTGW
ncbi:MAG: leucine-rich repeat domain-containing protein [Methylococcales bacterium]|nr:leucine-rich repeat domain-containing protein [Methylococcales bacterium]MDP3010423.1 leucine-rich repeat domain-containing protein [Methylococcales bacterium]